MRGGIVTPFTGKQKQSGGHSRSRCVIAVAFCRWRRFSGSLFGETSWLKLPFRSIRPAVSIQSVNLPIFCITSSEFARRQTDAAADKFVINRPTVTEYGQKLRKQCAGTANIYSELAFFAEPQYNLLPYEIFNSAGTLYCLQKIALYHTRLSGGFPYRPYAIRHFAVPFGIINRTEPLIRLPDTLSAS